MPKLQECTPEQLSELSKDKLTMMVLDFNAKTPLSKGLVKKLNDLLGEESHYLELINEAHERGLEKSKRQKKLRDAQLNKYFSPTHKSREQLEVKAEVTTLLDEVQMVNTTRPEPAPRQSQPQPRLGQSLRTSHEQRQQENTKSITR